jgi:hypothetical protein
MTKPSVISRDIVESNLAAEEEHWYSEMQARVPDKARATIV